MPTVMITGANRGLGLEFSRQYASEGWKVIATCRSPETATNLRQIIGDVKILPLDISDFSAIEKTSEKLKSEKIDLLLNNAGIYDRKKKGFGETNYEDWTNMMLINVQGPLKMIESFLSQVVLSEKKLIVSISSLLGSITANEEGGQYAYRTSKAALNATNKSLSIDLARMGIISIVISPGWVRTDMGGPGAAMDPVDSVSGIRGVISRLDAMDNGKFFNFDGSIIEW